MKSGHNETLFHGGDLETVSLRYGVPLDEWIDLSTGISPLPYPDTHISHAAFSRMPYQQVSFRNAVRSYYGNNNFLAVNGSQQIISVLPKCLKKFPIVLPDIGYKEHEFAWVKQGVELIRYPAQDPEKSELMIDQLLETGKSFHLLVINPNNPACSYFSPAALKRWASRLDKAAVLIIDEAFADLKPSDSVLSSELQKNMIVLRSFGKFFGLPGLRLGFVFADEILLGEMRAHVGVWDVNGPAQEIAIRALKDDAWQRASRRKLFTVSAANQQLWREMFMQLREQGHLIFEAHHALFSSYRLTLKKAEELFDFFAQKGILLRLIKVSREHALIRIGRVDSHCDHQVTRLSQIIKQCMCVLAHPEHSKRLTLGEKYG